MTDEDDIIRDNLQKLKEAGHKIITMDELMIAMLQDSYESILKRIELLEQKMDSLEIKDRLYR